MNGFSTERTLAEITYVVYVETQRATQAFQLQAHHVAHQILVFVLAWTDSHLHFTTVQLDWN